MNRRIFFKQFILSGFFLPNYLNTRIDKFPDNDIIIDKWNFDELNMILGGIKSGNLYSIRVSEHNHRKLEFNNDEKNHYGYDLHHFKEGFVISLKRKIINENLSKQIYFIDNHNQSISNKYQLPECKNKGNSIICFQEDGINNKYLFECLRTEKHYITFNLVKYFISKKKNLLLLFDAEVISQDLIFYFPVRYSATNDKIL